jgi:TctA family transporter
VKIVLPIVIVAIVLGLLFPRMNIRVWTVMSLVIIAVIAYFFLKH